MRDDIHNANDLARVLIDEATDIIMSTGLLPGQEHGIDSAQARHLQTGIVAARAGLASNMHLDVDLVNPNGSPGLWTLITASEKAEREARFRPQRRVVGDTIITQTTRITRND